MDLLNILLIVVIIYVLYILFGDKSKKINKKLSKKNKSNNINKSNNKINNMLQQVDINKNKIKRNLKNLRDLEDLEDLESQESQESQIFVNMKPNPIMLNIQFHDDYRDIITALNNLVPNNKQIFNIANIPVKYSEIDLSKLNLNNQETRYLIKDFVKSINLNLSNQVPCVRGPNSGWDEVLEDPHFSKNKKNGFERIQKSLGLPVSLYNDPAGKSQVKLINVKTVQKYETEDEIKYSVVLILQKYNSNDQIQIKANFVQDIRILRDENDFFNSNQVNFKIAIESVFIEGYLTNEKYSSKCNVESSCGMSLRTDCGRNDLSSLNNMKDTQDLNYDINNLEFNNLTDPNLIQQVLVDKYTTQNNEMMNRVNMLDEEGQHFHRELQGSGDFDNFKGTRTILDDFNCKKTFV
jgi:hypothetical protein